MFLVVAYQIAQAKAIVRSDKIDAAPNVAIVIVEDFTMEAPKTKQFIEIVNNLKVNDKKALFVLPSSDKNVYLSARNIQRVNVALASALNTYTVLNADVMVVTESSLKVVDEILTK